MDRHPRAGEVLEVLGIVLVAEHVHRPAALQRRADPVRADELLRVAEARGELDAIEVPLKIAVAGQPDKHHACGIGEDDADRLALQVVAQVPSTGRALRVSGVSRSGSRM